MPTSNRRPSWLHLVCTPGNPAHLKARKCDGCSQWTITCESVVWESYDPGIITGDDITIAIILGRPLTRMEWDPILRHAILFNERTTTRLDPTATYLTFHRCGRTPVSLKPFRPPRRRMQPNTWKTDIPESTAEEIREFERIWKTPISRLEKTTQ